MKSIRRILTALALLLETVSVFSQSKEKADSLVRLMNAQSAELLEIDGQKFRKVIGPARFLHNGTYLICDTALWNVDMQIINAWGNVQVLQDETILTSDKLDYLIEEDVAQFRGGVVEMYDKDKNTLRTTHLDYNTKDSTAVFRYGASMKSSDGQIIESLDGEYDSKLKIFRFENKVNMFTDTVFVKTERLDFHTDENKAYFTAPIDVWQEDNMLSSRSGWYDRETETFFFNDNVHAQTQDQEVWSDSLFLYRTSSDVEMRGSIQLKDRSRGVTAMSQYMYYADSVSTLTLEVAVGMMSESEDEGESYLGADKLVYNSKMVFELDSAVFEASQKRLKEIRTDALNPDAASDQPAPAPAASPAPRVEPETAAEKPEGLAMVDSLGLADSLKLAVDSLSLKLADSLTVQEEPLDSTKIAFVTATGNVRAWREDLQMACDSLEYTDLDSLARLYLNPVIWNESNRQYSADSIVFQLEEGHLRKADLMSNAFVAIMEGEEMFDQIKSVEIMAYFDTAMSLTRFDALGGASSIFFLEENGTLATVVKSESKLMTAVFEDSNLQNVRYFEKPSNDAYPVVQLSKTDRYLKGFKWQPERRPFGRDDILLQPLRESERDIYDAKERTSFRQTDIYFPGYMKGVYAEIEASKERKRLAQAQADSLAMFEEELAPADSLLAAADSLAAAADSVSTAADSLGTAGADKVALADSVNLAAGDSLALADSAAVAPKGPSRKELLEQRRLAKEAERELKWARLDSLDALKAQKREAKKLEKKRQRTYEKLLAAERDKKRDDKIRDRYIEMYTRRKEKQTKKEYEREQRSQIAGERP